MLIRNARKCTQNWENDPELELLSESESMCDLGKFQKTDEFFEKCKNYDQIKKVQQNSKEEFDICKLEHKNEYNSESLDQDDLSVSEPKEKCTRNKKELDSSEKSPEVLHLEESIEYPEYNKKNTGK